MFTDVGVVPFSVYGAALSGVAPNRKELFGKEEIMAEWVVLIARPRRKEQAMPLPKWEALSDEEKKEITEAAKCIRVTFQMKSYPEGYVIIWW